MPIYTVVHEGYDVDVYRTRKALIAFVTGNGLCLEPEGDDEPAPATDRQLIAALRRDSVVRLHAGGGDWTHRIERHDITAD